MSILNDMLNPASLDEARKGKVIYLELDEIEENKYNMFKTEDIEILAENVRLQGLLQPLIVFKKDGKNILHTGHRRYKALKYLMKNECNYKYFEKDITGTAPCIFINYNEDDAEFKISMIRSNSYRHLTDKEKENLIDITLEYVNCLESNGKREKGRTREIISEITGISVYFIQNYLSNKNKEKNYGLNQTEESTEQEIGTKLKKFVKKLDKLSEEALKIEFEEVSFEEHELLKDAIEDLKNSLDKIIY